MVASRKDMPILSAASEINRRSSRSLSNLSTDPVLRNAIFTHRMRLSRDSVRVRRHFAHGASGKAPVSDKARFAHETYSAAQSVRVRRRFAHEGASEAGAVSDKGRFAHE